MFELFFSLYLTSLQQNSDTTEFFLNTPNEINLEISPLPTIKKDMNTQLSAKSFLAIDVNSNIRLFEKNADTQVPMASLTKLMTALIIAENHNLNEVVTISRNAVYTEGSKIWLLAGEQLTVENLLKGLLVKSGNDAAIALAEFHSSSTETFVEEMNRRAKSLNMKNTVFKNPHGLDEEGQYSTANDLLLLTQAFWKHNIFHNIVNQKTTTIYSLNGKSRGFDNTNKLLSSEIQGIKTGTTDLAGQCLILFVERDNKKIFTIVLGSKNRFSDSKKFVNSIWENITW